MSSESYKGTSVADKQQADEVHICRVCGKKVDRIYQNDTCKRCLVVSFKKIVPMINHYRGK